MRILFVFVFLTTLFVSTAAQTKKNFLASDIDSLKAVVKTQKDTFEVKTLLNISQAVSTVDPKAAVDYVKQAITKAKKINYRTGELKGYNNLGGIYLRLAEYPLSKRYIDTTILLAEKYKDYGSLSRGYQNNGNYYFYRQQYDSSIVNFKIALGIATDKQKDSVSIGKCLLNIANCYNLIGEYATAITYFIKALKINEAVGDDEGIILTNGNIGNVYYNMKNYPEAEKYMRTALELAVKTNRKAQMSALGLNLGVLYKDNNQFDKAQIEFEKAYQMKKEIGDKRGEGMVLVNLGELYASKGETGKALDLLQKAENIAKEIKNYQIELYTYTFQANLYAKNNDIANASKKYESAIAIAEKLDLKPDLLEIYKLFSEATSKAGNFEKAYKYHLLYASLKDTLLNADNNKVIAEMNSKYESEKKQSQIELLNKDKEKQEAVTAAESKKQQIIIASVTTGLLLVVLLALFIFRGYRQKQKANEEITLQKEIIEERNKEVHDSITYAKRIQTAILPSDKIVNLALPNSFVLFKPKDIVSGDFYWIEKKGDKVFYAAVDCTGHGVPGAMVSVVGHNALNRTIKEFGLISPAAMLDKLNELVEETFEKSENEVKDGMDISLCCLDLKTNELIWAGANNPLWIVGKDGLSEIKADKQPIGKFDFRKPFTEQKFQLSAGDTVYVFTDGYADQFGGDKGKKFKYQQLKNLLLSVQNEELRNQRTKLDSEFEAWRGNLEQVDDVCMIGVRI